MKGGITLAIYIAIGLIPVIAGPAGGQSNAIKPAPLARPPDTVIIRYGQGGRMDEHRQRFVDYRQTKTKVEIRGPCYSACTMVLTYVEPTDLCIAEGAFMAFHAVRSMETKAYMRDYTQTYYIQLPPSVRSWIDRSGGWEKLPLDGYWTMYDRDLWGMGYPRCAP